jgi:hypothetical protein
VDRLRVFQREAGYTRTGSHNTRVHGRETGQWHEADLAVAHWLQHTSRDGDTQLHVHSQIAHVAKTVIDGRRGALEVAQAHAGWADKLARTLGVGLASVAPSVWHVATGRAAAHAHGAEANILPELELARAAQKAVALAQQEKSTWTRADVIKYLGRVLSRSGMGPAAAAALLEDLADRALRSKFEPVICMEAPEPADVPRSLLRADGRSVYQRHGGTRYTTPRAAGHGRTDARASPRERRAAPDPQASCARSRRRPGAARCRARGPRGHSKTAAAGTGGRLTNGE